MSLELTKAEPRFILTVGNQVLDLSREEVNSLQTQIVQVLQQKQSGLIGKIKTLIAAHYSLSVAALEGRGRTAQVVKARWMAMALCRKLLCSLDDIAKGFGERDPSTVRYALSEVDTRMELYPAMRKELDFLAGKI